MVARAALAALGGQHQVSAVSVSEGRSFLPPAGRWAAAPQPQLILLDLTRPTPADWSLLAELKSAAAFRRLPILVWYTAGDGATRDRAYDLQANACIAQPADSDRFAAVVRAIGAFWLTLVQSPAP
jgi:CheY-like chemotaxis protein